MSKSLPFRGVDAVALRRQTRGVFSEYFAAVRFNYNRHNTGTTSKKGMI
ncbi:MAG: hypothetical protein LAT80_12235 [Balneolaceae bacterium]|nr:hypothetical protein [Balneolaceae bacterium]